MKVEALFGLSVAMSFVAFGIVTKLYIWPRLRAMSRDDALTALLVPHAGAARGPVPKNARKPLTQEPPLPPRAAGSAPR